MATKNTTASTNSFEQNLWDTANKLRGSVESSEYKHVVLSLIFLKFIKDQFEAQRKRLVEQDYVAYQEIPIQHTATTSEYFEQGEQDDT
jgi:type I restriction enzyme M protein